MRHDEARRQRETYPFGFEIAVRYGDLDTNNHLNNVAFARFCEEGRVRIHHELRLRRVSGFRPIVANLNLNFLAEGSWPAMIEVRSGVAKLGTSSYVLAQALFQDGRCIALAETVMVNRKEDGAGGAPLSDAFRQALEPLRLTA